MRLIDVDKLEADVEYWKNHDDPKKPDYDTRDIEQVIGFQPIVEAIPIEWIKHWCIKNYPTYPRIITEELLKKTETWLMIDDWREENEQSDN